MADDKHLEDKIEVQKEIEKIFKDNNKEFTPEIKESVNKILEGIDTYKQDSTELYNNLKKIQALGVNVDFDEKKNSLVDKDVKEQIKGSTRKAVSKEDMEQLKSDLKEKFGENYILRQSDVEKVAKEQEGIMETSHPKISIDEIKDKVNKIPDIDESTKQKKSSINYEALISIDDKQNKTMSQTANLVFSNGLKDIDGAGQKVADLISTYAIKVDEKSAHNLISSLAGVRGLNDDFIKFGKENEEKTRSEMADIEKDRRAKNLEQNIIQDIGGTIYDSISDIQKLHASDTSARSSTNTEKGLEKIKELSKQVNTNGLDKVEEKLFTLSGAINKQTSNIQNQVESYEKNIEKIEKEQKIRPRKYYTEIAKNIVTLKFGKARETMQGLKKFKEQSTTSLKNMQEFVDKNKNTIDKLNNVKEYVDKSNKEITAIKQPDYKELVSFKKINNRINLEYSANKFNELKDKSKPKFLKEGKEIVIKDKRLEALKGKASPAQNQSNKPRRSSPLAQNVASNMRQSLENKSDSRGSSLKSNTTPINLSKSQQNSKSHAR